MVDLLLEGIWGTQEGLNLILIQYLFNPPVQGL